MNQTTASKSELRLISKNRRASQMNRVMASKNIAAAPAIMMIPRYRFMRLMRRTSFSGNCT